MKKQFVGIVHCIGLLVHLSLLPAPKQLSSIPPVAALTLANAIGVPFVDKPVTVSSLSIVKSINYNSIFGVHRYTEIDKLGMLYLSQYFIT